MLHLMVETDDAAASRRWPHLGPSVRQQLAQQVIAFTSPTSTPDQRAAALQAISAFIAGLPAANPGAVFQRLAADAAARQLRMPLLACPALPPAETLRSLGCFELHTGAGCAALVNDVRDCGDTSLL